MKRIISLSVVLLCISLAGCDKSEGALAIRTPADSVRASSPATTRHHAPPRGPASAHFRRRLPGPTRARAHERMPVVQPSHQGAP